MAEDLGLQGFNDSELEDIMNEIESLEKEVVAGPPPKTMKAETKSPVPEAAMEVPVREEMPLDADMMDEEEDLEQLGQMEEDLSVGLGVKKELEGEVAELSKVNLTRSTQFQNDIDKDVMSIKNESEREMERQWEKQREKENREMRNTGSNTPKESGTGKKDYAHGRPAEIERRELDLGPETTVPSRMDFSISGHMALHLCFHFSDQKVHLKLDGSRDFVIELEGGARFTLPLGK